MLVGFNPSLSTPSVNRRTPNRTSFQSANPPRLDLNKLKQTPVLREHEVTMVGNFLGQGGEIALEIINELISKTKEGGSKALFLKLRKQYYNIA